MVEAVTPARAAELSISSTATKKPGSPPSVCRELFESSWAVAGATKAATPNKAIISAEVRIRLLDLFGGASGRPVSSRLAVELGGWIKQTVCRVKRWV